jgi:hypothetical protein
MIGAWLGAALGLMSFALLRWVAETLERRAADPQQRRSAGLIRVTAFADLMLFPIIGYVLGPMLLEG